MLEYFSYKKYKKNKEEKEQKEQHDKDKGKLKEEAASAGPSSQPPAKPTATTQLKERPKDKAKPEDKPILDHGDETFFERLTSGRASVSELDEGDDAEKPPLPPRVQTPDLSWDSDAESFVKEKKTADRDGKDGKDADKSKKGDVGRTDSKKGGPSAVDKIGRRISVLVRRPKKDVKPTNLAVPEPEVDKETNDLSRVLDELNLSAKNNKVFSLSKESSEVLRQFTLVLKDLVNGVPTAADDLKNLLEDKDGTIKKSFEKLPKSLKKLVTQLPTKMTSTLAPELLAVAAESQGMKHEGSSKSTLKSLLMPTNLTELVTKPSAIIGMLKAIMNALKLRWPAFIGTSAIWSVALFILLTALWYCHKRGREVRLEKESGVGADIDGPRVEELPDDPALPEGPGSATAPIHVQPPSEEVTSAGLPPPPVGAGASAQKSSTTPK